MHTWPECALGTHVPLCVSEALELKLVQGLQAPLVHVGPESTLLSHVGVDLLQHINSTILF